MRELWRPIEEFPRYHVSNFGRVKNSKTGRILRPGRNSDGYIIHGLSNGKRHTRRMSRLVASAFIGNVDGFDVDHLDNDITNNHVDNLEIVTHAVNMQRAVDRGRAKMIPVRIVETGEEFRSIADCARFLNRANQNVHEALRKGIKTAGVHIEEVIL